MKISAAPLSGVNLVRGVFLANGSGPFSVQSYATQRVEDVEAITSSAPDFTKMSLEISWLTVAQLTAKHPAFSENSLRALIFAAKPRVGAIRNGAESILPGNGLAVAIRRIGRRVLINESEFLHWVDRQGRDVYQPHR